MEKLPLDLMPRQSADWKRQPNDRHLLKNIQTDPLTGVKTTWTKDIKRFLESRYDQLPGDSLSRYVSRKSEPGKTPESPNYTLDELVDGTRKTFYLNPSGMDTNLWQLNMHVVDLSLQDSFHVSYDNSNLAQVSISHYSFDLGYEINAQLEESMPDNIRALAEVCRLEGPTAAFFPELGPLSDQLTSSQEQIVGIELESFEYQAAENMKSWSDDEKYVAKLEVETLVAEIINENLQSGYSPEEKANITGGLVPRVYADLPFNYNAKTRAIDKVLEIAKAVESNVAMLVLGNKTKYELVGDFTTILSFERDNGDGVGLEITDMNEEVIHRGSLRFGEAYRYQENSYAISRGEHGEVIVSQSSLLKNNPTLQLTVPSQIDLDEFEKRLMVPESVGWERALEIIDVDYKKIVV